MLLGSTFEIGTQIILLKIDGFVQRLDLKYHPSLRGSLMLIQDQFGVIQNIQMSSIRQTSFLAGTFFSAFYSIPVLIRFLKIYGLVGILTPLGKIGKRLVLHAISLLKKKPLQHEPFVYICCCSQLRYSKWHDRYDFCHQLCSEVPELF